MFQADVFSAGIIMCETIARIEADPDILPRTQVRQLTKFSVMLITECETYNVRVEMWVCEV